MCYSAQIKADYRHYVRLYGADVSIEEFVELFWSRHNGSKVKVPKAMEAAFSHPITDPEHEIKRLIDEFNGQQRIAIEQELFDQRRRLADAERSLQVKVTKTASESRRVATKKIERARARLSDLSRSDLSDADSRIFPGYYAPVMVFEEGRRVIKPMRYQCRPKGKPAFYDTKYPGTYNAFGT